MSPEDNTLMLELALAECRRLRAALDAEQRAHCATHDALTEARAGLAASVPRDVHDRVAAEATSQRTANATLSFDLRLVQDAAAQARKFVVAGKCAAAVAELDRVLPCAE